MIIRPAGKLLNRKDTENSKMSESGIVAAFSAGPAIRGVTSFGQTNWEENSGKS
jgi:hypothetical protein